MAYTITQNSGTQDIGRSWGAANISLLKTAQSFTTIGAGTVTSVEIHIAKAQSSITGTVMIQIFTDNAGVPGTQVGADSNTYTPTVVYTGSSPFSTLDVVTFPTPPSVSAATKYWVVYNRSAVAAYPDAYVNDQGTTAGSGGGDTANYDGVSWAGQNIGQNAKVNIATAAAVNSSFFLLF